MFHETKLKDFLCLLYQDNLIDMSNSTAGTKDQLFFVYIPVGKASSALILVIDLGVLGDYENLIIIVSTIHSKSNSYHIF